MIMRPNRVSPTFIIRLKGGIGNQMFAYAFALSLSKKYSAKLLIDDISLFRKDRYKREAITNHFNIKKIDPPSIYRTINFFGSGSRFLKTLFGGTLGTPKRYFYQYSNQEHDFPGSVNFDNSFYIFEPLAQGEHFFNNIIGELCIVFKQTNINDMNIRRLRFEVENCQSVGIHVRCFKQDDPSSQINLDSKYYKNALQKVLRDLHSPRLFVFSNNIKYAKSLLNNLDFGIDIKFVSQSTNSAYEDFFLLRGCSHVVVSNSTFSWWAAYLAELEFGAKVFAPDVINEKSSHISDWGFPGLIPERWKLVPGTTF